MRGLPFKKGNPGGPGRPPGSGHVAYCREWAELKGFDFMARVAEGIEPGFEDKAQLRVEAARYLIDRGYGRPGLAQEEAAGDDKMRELVVSLAVQLQKYEAKEARPAPSSIPEFPSLILPEEGINKSNSE